MLFAGLLLQVVEFAMFGVVDIKITTTANAKGETWEILSWKMNRDETLKTAFRKMKFLNILHPVLCIKCC